MAGNPPERQEDVERVLAEETARGTTRRLPDEEALEERKQLFQDMRTLLRLDRKDLIAVLTEHYGLQRGSEEYNLALQAWNEYHAQRR